MIDSDTWDFLRQLLQTPGPSGHEERAARVWRSRATGYGTEPLCDVVGNSFAVFNAAEPGSPRVIAMAATQEDIAFRGGGALAGAQRSAPAVSIVVDVAFATDHPRLEAKADAIVRAGRGVATGLVSIPNRYMHPPNELVSLEDVDRAATLLAVVCRAIRRAPISLRGEATPR